jgi:hypothetical protein
MPIKPKVSLDFIRLTDPADKVSFGNDVIQGLTTFKSDFPNLPEPLPALIELNNALSDGITQAATGNFAARKALEKKIKMWNDGFRNNAVYVDGIANGDEELIARSGYKSTRTEPVHTKVPGAADKFELIPENEPGAFGVKSHVPGATSYLFIAFPDGVTVQQDHDMLVITVEGKKLYLMADTHSNVHFSHTETGTPLNVQVMGFNLAGTGPLSNTLRARP